MFCAGLTVFAPLYRHGTGPGKKVGVMGIGGLGHYAILFAKALGAEVYVFTHSPNKADDARKMGADHVIDYTKANWQKEVMSITKGHGVDVIYDPVGRIRGKQR